MGICVFGHWLFGKPDYVKKMEEIEKLGTEIEEIKWMIDQETVRFHRDMDRIVNGSEIRSNEILAASERDIERIDENETPVLKEAEITLFLANVDLELTANMQDALHCLAGEKSRHDTEMARLIERRDACYTRLDELVDDYRACYGGFVDF